jgi:hypothetical protein
MKPLAHAAATVLIAVLLPGGIFAQASASVCVAPVFEKADPRSAPGLFCDSEKLSLRIDAQKAIPWPMIPDQPGSDRSRKSVKIAALDAAARHRVVVFCNGKPQQSFAFRFSDYKTSQLCLFINDLYKTVNLSEAKACPWCKCK